MIKGLLFDYGGTIDTNGLHWGYVLETSYKEFELKIPHDLFSKAYAFGERSLAINAIVKPSHNFHDVLSLKIGQQFQFLEENGIDLDGSFIKLIADHCNEFAQRTVKNAKPILEDLAKDYPLVMVSNFYGNLNTVLEVFGIKHLFKHVVESAVVGVRKPDPAIYALGVEQLGFLPEECLVIGDSFAKDIVPGKEVGCKTVWIKGESWNEDVVKVINNPVISDVEVFDIADIRKHLVLLD
jgi:HAD superfamily hydrolase (TIGR01509 family)